MARPAGAGHGRSRAGRRPGTLARAVDLVDRYGDELEYDLHAELGLDLLDWLRGRHPWGKLLRLAAQLPRHSRYQAAVADDDEIAEQLLALAESDPQHTQDRTLAGYDDHLAVLTSIFDALRAMHATLIAANSKNGRGPEVKPTPRPRTALDRARRRRNLAEAEQVRRLFAPRGA